MIQEHLSVVSWVFTASKEDLQIWRPQSQVQA
jgi:hypothetical protein